MVSKNKNGTTRFTLRPGGGASDVFVAGSFSQWTPLEMKKQKDGSFARTMTIPAGTHEYRFIVDGNWTTDPDNSTYVLNPYGSANSVAKAA
jgi:1,4-alpha-glucan branching enzyme